MVLRLWPAICRMLSILMLAALPAAPAMAQAQRIVAVGDLHGDDDVWLDIARGAGLIDARNHWAAGRTTLVQAGDVVDRGADSRKIIAHLRTLQKEAPRAGGKVIVLLGNHEAMNMTGDLRYVDAAEMASYADGHSEALRQAAWDANGKRFIAEYRARHPAMTDEAIHGEWLKAMPLGMIEHDRAWAPDGEIGRWVSTLPAVVKIGDSIFVHGGLSAAYANLPADQINSRADAALKARDTAQTAIINDPLGPLWYRGNITRGPLDQENWAVALAANPALAKTPRLGIDQELDAVLAGFGAKRLVVAHTPNLAGIDISHGGKLVRIDTGNSRYYKGQPSWLEINGDTVTPHSVARSIH